MSNNQPVNQIAKYSNFYDDYLKNNNFQDKKKSWNKIAQVFDLPEVNKNPRYVSADVLNKFSGGHYA